MKRKGGGKAKGSAYERDTSRRLSIWVSKGERKDLYWRSAGSGSVATRNRFMRKTQSGDIGSVAVEGAFLTSLFCLECKRYASFGFDKLINGGKSGFLAMWRKLVMEARRANKTPVMIMRANFGEELWATDNAGVAILKTGMGEVPAHPWVVFPQLGITFYRLDDVFGFVDPTALRIPRRRLS